MATNRETLHVPELQPREIERRFRVSSLPENLDYYPYTDIRQGTLLLTPDASLRVREEIDIWGDVELTQTLKLGTGMTRTEIEIPLSEEQFETLFLQTTHGRMEKRRYVLPDEHGNKIQVNIHHGTLEGFVSAEVEFTDEQHAKDFLIPDWFGEELTDIPGYTSAELSLNGLPQEPLNVQNAAELQISDDLKENTQKLFSRVDSRLAESNGIVIICAAGRSNAGKSSAVTEQVINRYGDYVLIVPMDNYFGGDIYMEKIRETVPDINWDHPDYLNFPLFLEHLRILNAGGTVDMPQFNFKTGEPDLPPQTISAEGKRIILVEGIHALNDKLDEFTTINVFVDISLHGSIIRRLLRDTARTNLDPAQILKYYLETVEPMYQKFIAPTKARADIVMVNEYNPEYEAQRAQRTQHQVKYRTELITSQIQAKAADHIATVDQRDYYFYPKDGVLNDEIFRIREEHGYYFLTYKGPQEEHKHQKRPVFNFLLDPESALRLIESGQYGQVVKQITKHREIYSCDGLVFSLDTCTALEDNNTRWLGKFIEVRLNDDDTPEDEQRLMNLMARLDITSDPEKTPYVLM